MIPILFEHDATDFTGHGLGDLIDCITCEATCNADGEYEMAFQYPVSAPMYSELKINRIVYVKANDYDPWQAFRIYGYEKEIKGIQTVNCQHISYDLHCIPTKEMKDITSCSSALSLAKSQAFIECPFTFTTDIERLPHAEEHKYKSDAPKSIRALLLDGNDSIRGAWGGDLVFNNFSVSLLQMAGQDRGVTLDYGVDITDLDMEESISEMITGVLPYFRYNVSDEDSESATYGDTTDYVTYGNIQYIDGTFEKENIQPLDLTDQFPNYEQGTYPSASELNSRAQEWIRESDVGHPIISLVVSYATLGQDVRLHDAVTVRFPRMGIDVKSKVSSYKYDVLAERPVEIEIGKTKASSMFSLEDASRLKKGLIPVKRIQNKSITSQQLQNGSVGNAALSNAGVSGGKIQGNAVGNWHLREKAVTEEKLAENSVTQYKIKNGAIVEEKVAVDAITAEKIKAKAVELGKIDDKAVDLATLSDELAGFYTFWLKAELIFASEIYADQGEYGWITTGHIKGTWLYGDHLVVGGNEYVDWPVSLDVVAGVSLSGGGFSAQQGASYNKMQVYQEGDNYYVNCPYVYYQFYYSQPSLNVLPRTYRLRYLGYKNHSGD